MLSALLLFRYRPLPRGSMRGSCAMRRLRRWSLVESASHRPPSTVTTISGLRGEPVIPAELPRWLGSSYFSFSWCCLRRRKNRKRPSPANATTAAITPTTTPTTAPVLSPFDDDAELEGDSSEAPVAPSVPVAVGVTVTVLTVPSAVTVWTDVCGFLDVVVV